MEGQAVEMSPAPLDLRGLAGPVSWREVRDFYSALRVPASRRWWAIAAVVCVYLAGQAVFIGIMLPATGIDDGILRPVFVGFLAFTSLYGAFLILLVRRNVVRQVRLWRMARANGMDYADRAPISPFPGTAVVRARGVNAVDVIDVPPSPTRVAFTAATFQSRPGFTVRRSALALVPLDRVTPHIVLENSRARVFRGTGYRFDRQQRLHLEGDFDRTFSLYCPVGYERDALYIFTPDLMVLLLDLASDCEVELVDGYFIVYSGHPWKLWRPQRFSAVYRVAELVGAKAQRRTVRYRDDRSVPVSPTSTTILGDGGRQLRTHASAATVLWMAFAVLIGVAGVLTLFWD